MLLSLYLFCRLSVLPLSHVELNLNYVLKLLTGVDRIETFDLTPRVHFEKETKERILKEYSVGNEYKSKKTDPNSTLRRPSSTKTLLPRQGRGRNMQRLITPICVRKVP